MIVENLTTAHYSRLDISNRSAPFKTTATVVLIIAANLIKYYLKDYVGAGTPFLVYFGFIMLCGRFIGFWYGMMCTIACGITAAIFFMLPYEAFTLSSVIKLLIYGIEGFFIALLSNGFRKTLIAVSIASNNFKMLISKSQDGLARISKEGKILYISPLIETITGLKQEALKSGGFDIFPEETDRQEVAARFLKVISEPLQSVTFTHRYKNKQGETRWMETIFTNHLNVIGIHAIIANFRDVTERVEAETRKNDFMGIAAHEIKNPITAVTLNAGVQQMALEDNDYALAKKCNIVIQENTKKVSRLLGELMDFSGFESALLNLQFSSFDVCGVINSSIETFSAGYKNEVVVQGDATTVINADRSRIEQVIVNLLSNAAKYSAAGSIVTVNCAVADSNITISIIDKGMGIPERELGLLFNKFHRVRSTHNKTKGYGLGLYICAEIIKAHKGKIGVESKEGEGSVFWFSLPLSSAAHT
ncbi:hypothetical protein BH10BAC2_BH10BAC2_21650 [soil metagenome]